MKRTPALSVVMATYNRAEVIKETVAHLCDQELSPDDYEVIIVDDGSKDHTRDVVEELARSVPFKLTFFSHPNAGPGYTQNRGIRAAAAPVVLLMADDIFMTRTALSAHLEAHRSHPGREWAVLGHTPQSPELGGTAFMRIWNPFMMEKLPDKQELPYHFFWACNVSFKREFMMEHGMFNDEMGVGGPAAHEDVELGYRLHTAGMRLIHEKAALGYHHHVETLEGMIARSHERGLNWPRLRERVGQPEISVRYRVLNPDTLSDHVRALFGPRRKHLLGVEASPVWMPLRYLGRALAFNRVTVPMVWLPLFDKAEKSPAVEKWIGNGMYRGVISHYFCRAVRSAGAASSGTAARPDSAASGL